VSVATLAALADALARAERERAPIEPLTDEHPDLSASEAYEIQRLGVTRRLGDGARIVGHKVGLTARAMQQMFGVNEPDYGHLLDVMVALERSVVSVERFIAPMVEVEPAFVLGKRLCGPGVIPSDVIRATDHVLPALEIIDSRIRDWRIQLADTIADNGSSAGLVLGGRPLRLDQLDVRDLDAAVEVDGTIAEQGNTRAILGSPINAVAWLANALGRHGIALEPGHVVLPGTCARAVPVGRGVVRGRFEILGDVEVTFA
jgi:2-keto-4-pentenoate hydratase